MLAKFLYFIIGEVRLSARCYGIGTQSMPVFSQAVGMFGPKVHPFSNLGGSDTSLQEASPEPSSESSCCQCF